MQKLRSAALAALAAPVAPGTWLLVIAVVLSMLTGGFFLVATVCSLLIAAALSWVVGVGTALMAAALWLASRLAGVDRRRISRWYQVSIAPVPLPARQPGKPRADVQRSWRRSSAAWRLAGYQLVRAPALGAGLFVLVLCWWTVIGLLFIVPLAPRPLAPAFTSWVFGHDALGTGAQVVAGLTGFAVLLLTPRLVRGLARLDAQLGERMLGPGRADVLAGEVDRLAQSRALAVDAGDIERH